MRSATQEGREATLLGKKYGEQGVCLKIEGSKKIKRLKVKTMSLLVKTKPKIWPPERSRPKEKVLRCSKSEERSDERKKHMRETGSRKTKIHC